jgi:hypothetical protein
VNDASLPAADERKVESIITPISVHLAIDDQNGGAGGAFLLIARRI